MPHQQSILEDTNCSRRPGKSPATGNETSVLFYKLIVASINQDEKLRIPIKFVKKFRDELSSVVTLSLPNGRVWYVGLKKVADKIWFDNGWHEFIEHYSIRDGYFLVFKYQGGSNFNIHIYDLPTSEINYESITLSNHNHEELNHGKQCPAVAQDELNQRTTSSSMKNKVFDQCVGRQIPNNSYNPPSLRYFIKTYHECILGLEKLDINVASVDGTEKDDRPLSKNVQSSQASFVRDVSFKATRERLRLAQNAVNSQSRFRISRGNEINFSESKLRESTDEVGLNLQDEEKQRIETSKRQSWVASPALPQDELNQSSNPSSFKNKVFGQCVDRPTPSDGYNPPSLHNLVKTYHESVFGLDKQDRNASLFDETETYDRHLSKNVQNSQASVPITRDISFKGTGEQQRLAQNGIHFSESKLTESTDEVGLHLQDEAKQRIETSKRQIQRTESSKHKSSAKRKKEKETTNDIKMNSRVSTRTRPVTTQEKHESSAKRKKEKETTNDIKMNSRVSTRTRPVTTQEKQRTRCAATIFKPSNPFCKVILQPSHVYRVFLVHMPSSFAKKYLSEGSRSIKLETCDGKRWPVRCIKSVKDAIKLSKGWIEFVKDNNLEEGDVCVFELIQVNDIVLKVTIFRVLEDVDEDDESLEILGSSHPCPPHISLGKSEMPNSLRSSPSNYEELNQCSTPSSLKNKVFGQCVDQTTPSDSCNQPSLYNLVKTYHKSIFGLNKQDRNAAAFDGTETDGPHLSKNVQNSQALVPITRDISFKATGEQLRLAQNGIQFSESKLTESRDKVGLHLQHEAKQKIETSKRQIQRTEPNKHEPSAKRKKEKETTNDNIKRHSRVSTKTRPVTTQEKHRARFAATSFNTSNPFCKVIMKPSHVSRGFLLHMPSSFAKKYLSEGLGSIKLEACDGKWWPVRCMKSMNAIKLSKGWIKFAKDNSLEEGDVCVFELIQVNGIVLKVTIFRVLEDDTSPPTKPQPQISTDLY